MRRLFVPSILTPEFTWPASPLSSIHIQQTTPKVPRVPGKIARRAWGLFHEVLFKISQWYCHLFGVDFDALIVQLPFGLVMKWTERTSIEEYIAMQMVHSSGIPVPRAISCGEHKEGFLKWKYSILMTRLPGITLENMDDLLEAEAEEPWLEELRICVETMRKWDPPSQDIVCSPIGTSLRSSRVPGHIMGPFQDHTSFYKHLFAPASTRGFASASEYEKTLMTAKRLEQRPYLVKFTHGDFKAHNILVNDDGHLSGFLDWESGGWYPEYWEFTTAMRFGKDSWWYQVADWMGGNQYREEMKADKALNRLTVDSYIAF